nr:MAG TPA: hypothetical protein [Caudoviricetes sp.]
MGNRANFVKPYRFERFVCSEPFGFGTIIFHLHLFVKLFLSK